MRILVLGGSGFIGSAVVSELLAHKHHVLALARSDQSATRLWDLGAQPVMGSLNNPNEWLEQIPEIDAIIHMAASFDDDMADLDRKIIQALLEHPSFQSHPLKIIYTGGCWLYGATGDEGKTESAPFEPLKDFAFMLEQRNLLFSQVKLPALLVHPGLVWDETDGTLSAYREAIAQDQPLKLIGGAGVSWPLVHRKDLAVLYRLAAEKGTHGSDYLGISENLANHRIAEGLRNSLAPQLPIQDLPVEEAIETLGSWAAGYAMSQRLDSSATSNQLGWFPIEKGVLESISHMK